MPRGNTPRQPSRSGRHEKPRNAKVASPKTVALKSHTKSKGTPKQKTAAPRKPAPSRAASRPSNYDPLAPQRIHAIIAALDALYPNYTCALTHRNAWELVVATILSAQCTDVRVNMVTPGLFEKYPTVRDFAALEPEQLEPDIRSTGFFRNKAKSVVGAARKVVNDFAGEVPQTMEELLTLPGVARKTANVVLGTWFKKNEGIAVDTHVTRLSHRLELSKQEDPIKIEEDLMRIVPRNRWTDFSHEVIWHGRKVCIARKPMCADCTLEKICHATDKTWSTVSA